MAFPASSVCRDRPELQASLSALQQAKLGFLLLVWAGKDTDNVVFGNPRMKCHPTLRPISFYGHKEVVTNFQWFTEIVMPQKKAYGRIGCSVLVNRVPGVRPVVLCETWPWRPLLPGCNRTY